MSETERNMSALNLASPTLRSSGSTSRLTLLPNIIWNKIPFLFLIKKFLTFQASGHIQRQRYGWICCKWIGPSHWRSSPQSNTGHRRLKQKLNAPKKILAYYFLKFERVIFQCRFIQTTFFLLCIQPLFRWRFGPDWFEQNWTELRLLLRQWNGNMKNYRL